MNQWTAPSRLRTIAAVTVPVVVTVALVMHVHAPAVAQPADTQGPAGTAAPLTELKIVQRVTVSLDKAMAYLASQQQPDGRWSDINAINGVALLAYMGHGHVPGRGPYRDVIERGKRYLISTQREDGYLGHLSSHGRMYSHAMATLAMAELYGMDPDPLLEQALRKAVDLIVRAQSPNGGWRYQPKPGQFDLSVTVMQIVALRAANNAEVPVPEETISKAIEYVRSSHHGSGGFSYQPGQNPNPQMTAAGILSLQLLGQYDDPRIESALKYLANVKLTWGKSAVSYFYYFHYYAVQAHYQAGGDHWNRWHPQVREMLLSHQNDDGSWDLPPGTAEGADRVGANKVYWTAMASLVLEIYMHYLPAYQR